MNPKKLCKIIRVLTLIGLITLAALSMNYKFNHCSQCKFEYDGETMKTNELWSLYIRECMSNISRRDQSRYPDIFQAYPNKTLK